VVQEFYDRPWLPSPFVVFEDIARFINICRYGQEQYSAFSKTVAVVESVTVVWPEKRLEKCLIYTLKIGAPLTENLSKYFKLR